ncbi:histone H1-like [Dermacentor andersoni]|uniref:histone H1-like n=1 Tax=Dermacentor andersoni TaxID=34620 RepID=UPI002155E8C4|nr:histone H1B-like [Dermacentor andersoni]
MAEETSTAAAAPAASLAPQSPKKKAARGAGKPRTTASHPKVSAMVNASIGELKERGGSSLQAIKKHMAATYKVDVEKLSPFIRKYLKSAVTSGALVQTKGKGASGSFKLAAGAAAGEKKKAKAAGVVKKAAKKPAKKTPKKSPKKAPKKVAVKKAKPAKKPKAEKKASLPKKPKKPAAKKAATPKKAAKK